MNTKLKYMTSPNALGSKAPRSSSTSASIKKLHPRADKQGHNYSPPLFKKFLAIPTNTGDIIVPRSEIMWLKAEGNYTKIMLTNNRSFLLTKGISQLHKKLSDERFISCHQSHIINLEYVRRIVDKRTIFLSDSTFTHQIPISRRKINLLFQHIVRL